MSFKHLSSSPPVPTFVIPLKQKLPATSFVLQINFQPVTSTDGAQVANSSKFHFLQFHASSQKNKQAFHDRGKKSMNGFIFFNFNLDVGYSSQVNETTTYYNITNSLSHNTITNLRHAIKENFISQEDNQGYQTMNTPWLDSRFGHDFFCPTTSFFLYRSGT